MKKSFKKSFSYLVYGVLLIFALFFLGSAIPIFNYNIMTVISGSMEPTLKIGSVVVVSPAESYQVGDIVTFRTGGERIPPTTHRIEDVKVEEGELIYITKGDANPIEDIEETKEGDIMGKALFSIPYLGYLVNFLKTPIGFLLLVGLPALLIIFGEVGKIYKEVKNKSDTDEK